MPLTQQQVSGLTTGGGMAANFLGGIIGAIQQRRANKQQVQFDREAYELQRDDALKFWNMENQYNLPEAQMARLKAAGLNPNLMYGAPQSGGVAGSINTPHYNQSDVTKVSNPVPQTLGSDLTHIYDLRMRDAQINLLNEQAKTQATTRDLNAATTTLRALESARTELQTKLGKDTYDYQVNLAKSAVEKVLAEIANTKSQTRVNESVVPLNDARRNQIIDQNVRDWQKQKLSLAQMAATLLNTEANTRERQANLGLIGANTELSRQSSLTHEQNRQVQQLDTWMKANGFNANDSWVQRSVKRFLYSISSGKGDINKAVQEAKHELQMARDNKRR